MESLIPSSQVLNVVGLNHRTAPLAMRETVAFSAAQVGDALERFLTLYPGCEAAILSTCNRVELYAAHAAGVAPDVTAMLEFLAGYHKVSAADFRDHVYYYQEKAAVEHLFAVTSSLDSMVVGETQILGQVKQAYQGACNAHAAGPLLHGLFQRALAAGKEVHESTGLSAGRVSVAGVAVQLVNRVFDQFSDKTVLCLGAGKMAELMLVNMRQLGPKKIIVANRSMPRGQELAARLGAGACAMDQLDHLLIEADIVLAGTGSREPVISAAQFKALLKPRKYRPVVIVDIAVPRDVEPAVGSLPNVYLYNLDDLQTAAAGNRGQRERQIELSQEILARHVQAFADWRAARDTGPLVKALYERCHAVAAEELAQMFARVPEMSEAQRRQMQRAAHRIIGKILHAPVTRITKEAPEPARPALLAALRDLFALAETPAKDDANPGHDTPTPL